MERSLAVSRDMVAVTDERDSAPRPADRTPIRRASGLVLRVAGYASIGDVTRGRAFVISHDFLSTPFLI